MATSKHAVADRTAADPPHREDRYNFRVVGHGVDSIKFAFREMDYESVITTFSASHAVDFQTGEILEIERRGKNFFLRDLDSGAQFVLTFSPSGNCLLSLEARLSALISGSVTDRSLCDPSRVLEGANQAVSLAERLGIITEAPGALTVARIDLTADLEFEDPADGQRFLAGLNTLELPHCKRRATASAGNSLETVDWFRTGGIFARTYDKAAESRQKGRSHKETLSSIVRVERQIREPKKRQLNADQVDAQLLASMYASTFRPWTIDGLTVLPVNAIATSIISRVDQGSGSISLARAERLIGTAHVLTEVGSHVYDKRTLSSRRNEFRKLGISLDPTATSTLNIGEILTELIAAWERGR